MLASLSIALKFSSPKCGRGTNEFHVKSIIDDWSRKIKKTKA
jgi:hypothetical protein